MRNNGVFSLGAALLFVLIASTSGCELLTSKNDDCEATKMPETKEPIIYLRITVDPGPINTQVGTYYLKYADRLEIIGSVEKVYCSGKLSGRFTFNPSFFPEDMTLPEITAGLILPQPYQYKFDNDKDKLLIMYTLKAWFSGGKIFETDPFSVERFYKNLQYDVNSGKYYLNVGSAVELSPWRQVTSK